MTKSVIVWAFVTCSCYLLHPVCTGIIYTSKACYGSNPSCTHHHLRCNSTQKIAIYDAYYTNNTECGAGIANCDLVNPDNVTERGYHSFNNSELVSLYGKCSTQSQCDHSAPWRGATRSFSVVKYRCIAAISLNISGGAAKDISQVSLIHEATARHSTYVCHFTSTATNIYVYGLDSRLGLCLSPLTVQNQTYITTKNCSAVFKPFERLNVTEDPLQHLYFRDFPRLYPRSFWLLINATGPFNVTCETLEQTTERTESTKETTSQNFVSTKTTDSSIIVAGEAGSNTGGIVGGVVATVVAVLVVTLVSVWIVRRRRANSEGKENTKSLPKDVKTDMTYSLAGNIPENNYHEIQNLKTQNSDYDYATADGMVLPPTTYSYCIKPTGKQTAGNSSIASEAEGDYDHLGDKPPPQTSDYDTTASVAQPGHIGEDGYGYNHFQIQRRTNTQTHQNDYDTAASATKAVAQISTTKRITDEDDYDHFQRGANAKTVSSPYDTTSGIKDNSDYSVAGQMK